MNILKYEYFKNCPRMCRYVSWTEGFDISEFMLRLLSLILCYWEGDNFSVAWHGGINSDEVVISFKFRTIIPKEAILS
jgi:hypothetical protein